MEENNKKLEKELKYLRQEEIVKEINKHQEELKIKDVDVKNIANKIYLERGIDISKLNRNIFSNLINDLSTLSNIFKTKDKAVKKKIEVDIIYLVVLLILLKVPFDFVRDLGYDYIELLTSNSILYSLWNFAFLLLYTIVGICAFIVLIRNFSKKYNN